MLRLTRALVFVLAAPAALSAQEAPVAITGVTVIDVESGRRLADQTVIVRGNRIAEAGAGLRVPSGARVVDGAGRFLIPGLWDAHVHAVHPGDAVGHEQREEELGREWVHGVHVGTAWRNQS